jgi:hypothetical protein
MKNIFFLNGLPRAGNTLLGSLINQTTQIKVTAASIVPDILFELNKLKFNNVYLSFKDEKSFDNVLNNVFVNYYSDWNVPNIIDRGRWGTPANLFMLKKIIKKPKFIILYRPILECLASYVKITSPVNINEFCDYAMSPQGMIGGFLIGIKNIIKQKEKFILIEYKNLIQKPEKNIKNIFNFLNLKYEKIKFKNFKQFEINGIKYNDNIINCKNLHKIKTDKISLNEYKVEEILSKEIINKYSNLDI